MAPWSDNNECGRHSLPGGAGKGSDEMGLLLGCDRCALGGRGQTGKLGPPNPATSGSALRNRLGSGHGPACDSLKKFKRWLSQCPTNWVIGCQLGKARTIFPASYKMACYSFPLQIAISLVSPKHSGLKQQPFYFSEFCGPGIPLGHSRDTLSLLHDQLRQFTFTGWDSLTKAI